MLLPEKSENISWQCPYRPLYLFLHQLIQVLERQFTQSISIRPDCWSDRQHRRHQSHVERSSSHVQEPSKTKLLHHLDRKKSQVIFRRSDNTGHAGDGAPQLRQEKQLRSDLPRLASPQMGRASSWLVSKLVRNHRSQTTHATMRSQWRRDYAI